MTTPTQSVSVRRTLYNNQFMLLGAIEPVYYDDQYDSQQNVDVLDPVLAYDPLFIVNGYTWNGIRQQLSAYHLSFDGVGDQISIPHAISINNLPTGSFTVDFVAGNFGVGAFGNIIGKSDSGFLGWNCLYDSFDNSIQLVITYNSEASLASIYVYPVDTNLHHFEFAWNGITHTLKAFIDGIDNGTPFIQNPLTTYDNDSSQNMGIGKQLGDSYDLNFQLNWIRISNTVLHSSNFTPPSLNICPISTPSTVLRLALDEGSGTIVHDTSGNNNNGTITGATWARD